MKKIIVIGSPGSGKSCFSRTLHEITRIPVVHLDLLYWNADKTIVPKPIFLERLQRAMASDSWIIDGNYASTMEERMQNADTVIFLDYPTELCLAGLEARRGKPRPDMPWFEKLDEPIDTEFWNYVKSFSQTNRPQILALLKKHRQKRIIQLCNRQEADAFLKTLRNL